MTFPDTTLQRLLKYPHSAVFDDTPGAELALRVRHADGASWDVADGVLSVRAGALERAYTLSEYTFDSLALTLQGDGFEVPTLSPAWSPMSAQAMVEGVGEQGSSNGDHLQAFTSLLWVLFSGYAVEVSQAERQVTQALLQMFITTAEGEWLTLWGELYGVRRQNSESDAHLRARIPREAFRLRNNRYAIELAIKEDTGHDVEIREPNKLMFRNSVSKLSGTHHLHDADFYTHHIIQPVARQPINNWADVLRVIERNRAAGVLVYHPAVEVGAVHIEVQPPVEYLVQHGIGITHVMGAWPGGETPLGVMRLDDNEFTLNHQVQMFQLRTFSNTEGAQTEQGTWTRRNVAFASVALSGHVPLGDENAILSRGQVRYLFDPERTLSDELAPSDYAVTRDIRRVERVTILVDGREVDAGMEGPILTARTDVHAATASAYDGINAWHGLWDGRNWLGWRVVGSIHFAEP